MENMKNMVYPRVNIRVDKERSRTGGHGKLSLRVGTITFQLKSDVLALACTQPSVQLDIQLSVTVCVGLRQTEKGSQLDQTITRHVRGRWNCVFSFICLRCKIKEGERGP